MRLEELQKMVADDLPIKPSDIESSAIDNMKLYSKYLGMLGSMKMGFRKAMNRYNTIKLERYKYYTGRDSENVFEFVLTPTELKQFIQGDAELCKCESELDLVRVKVELIEETLKAIRDRGFTIKNIIELRKLESGA